MFDYKPLALEELCEKIVREHPNVRSRGMRRINESEIKRLWNEIRKLSNSELRKYAEALKNSQVEMLCGSMHDIKGESGLLNKALAIAYYRINAKHMLTLWSSFQYCYRYKMFRNCLVLVLRDKHSEEYLNLLGIEGSTLYGWLVSNDMSAAIAAEIVKAELPLEYGIERRKLSSGSLLTQDVRGCYFKICGAEVYCNTDRLWLEAVIKRYSDEDFNGFLLHFLRVMCAADERERMYRGFIYIMERALREGIEPDSIKGRTLFGNDHRLLNEYNAWFNYRSLLATFGKGGDDNFRIAFWKQYVAQCRTKVVSKKENTMLVLDFGGFYVIEFSIEGCIYFLARREFDEMSALLYSQRREYKLKSGLNAALPDDRRIPHTGRASNWQSKAMIQMNILERRYGKGNFDD